jgi:hypothetical protein
MTPTFSFLETMTHEDLKTAYMKVASECKEQYQEIKNLERHIFELEQNIKELEKD